MSAQQNHEASPARYDDDLAYVHDRGFGGLARAAAAALAPRLAAAGARRVIDVGCGSGLSTRALLDAGLEVLGIEPSEAFLALARARAPEARFAQTSVYDTELEPTDAILALGEALSYHGPGEDAEGRLSALFAAAARVLAPGGLLAFDVICRGAPPLDARSFARGDDWAVLSEVREDPAASTLTRDIETFRARPDGAYRRARELHRVRVFDADQVDALLAKAGFEVERAPRYGEYDLAPRRLAFLATKPRTAGT